MVRKILFIVVCCLCVFLAKAQPENAANHLLDSITKNIKTILKDNDLNENCKKAIKKFENDFHWLHPSDLNEVYIKGLIKKSNLLVAASKDTATIKCEGENIQSLGRFAARLIDELKKPGLVVKKTAKDSVIVAIKDSVKNKLLGTVPLSIKVVNSTTGEAVNGKLAIDSLGTPITRIINTDTGNFEALLFPGKKYALNISAVQYDTYNVEYESKANADSLSIPLHVSTSANVRETAAPVDLITPRLETLEVANILFLVAVAVLFILVIWASVLYVKTIKDFKLVIEKISGQVPEVENNQSIMENDLQNNTLQESPAVQEPEPVIETVAHEPASLQEAPVAAEKVIMPENIEPVPLQSKGVLVPVSPIVEKEIVNEPVKTGLYFVCEVLMTAGPRKKYVNGESNDKDLGEDVCGFVSNSNEIFIWLLDGTSDQHTLKNPVNKREYFSSRLLAQSIADQLRNYFLKNPSTPLDEMVQPAIMEVKSNWLEVINQLPAEEKLFLRNNIEKKIWPDCSTTLLVASLKLNGDFTSYRTGDSKLLLFQAATPNEVVLVRTPLEDKNDKSNDRIFFRLSLDENGKFDIKFNEPLHEVINKENIKTVISFSDGIGAFTEQLLKEDYKSRPAQVRKEIIYHSQETNDDKTIYFIEINESR